MNSIAISDEEEGIYLYSGMVLEESDINTLERIITRLYDEIAEFKKDAPTPGETRLNVIECTLNTILKAQVEAKKILDEARAMVSVVSRRSDHDREARTRMYKELDERGKLIDRMKEGCLQEFEARTKQDKRISDIEEFLGDL